MGSRRSRVSGWFRLLLLATMLALSTGRPALAGPVPSDQAGFTAYLAQAFQAALPGATVAVSGPLALTVTPAGGDPHQAPLDNVHSLCLRVPPACDRAVADHVAAMSASFAEPVPRADRAAVRAVVRPADYVEQIRETLKGKGDPVAVPLVGDLWLVAVLDRPTAIQVMRPEDLRTLALGRDEVLALARRNLAASLAPLDQAGQPEGRSRIALLTGDPYESSRLGLLDGWAALAKQSGGQLIAAVPATDVLLYSLQADAKGVAAMRRYARAVAEKAPRPLSLAVFRWTPGGWTEIGAAGADVIEKSSGGEP